MYIAESCRCEVLIITSCGNLVQDGQIQAILKDSKESAFEDTQHNGLINQLLNSEC